MKTMSEKWIGEFLFTQIDDETIIVYHRYWDWCERIEDGKRIIRLKAK